MHSGNNGSIDFLWKRMCTYMHIDNSYFDKISLKIICVSMHINNRYCVWFLEKKNM